MSGDDCDINLSVDQIHWSQDSIAGTFRDGSDLRALINSLRGLPHERRVELVATYPRIRVVQFESQGWITLDNRRLYLFREILDPGTQIGVRVATFQEAQELRRKLTTDNEGATIAVRANRR